MSDGTIRIAHIGDTHLGFSALTRLCPESGRNQRAVDVEHAFAAAIDEIIAAGDIDLVLHAGDVFHHSRPPMQTLIFFVQQMRRLEVAGIPTIVIGGNHDTPRLRNAGSVLDLCAVACHHVRFTTGYEWDRIPLTIRDRQVIVTTVPHGAFTNEQPPNALYAEAADAINVLVAHGSYNLAVTHDRRGGAEEIEDALLDARYDYIALGHWHLHERKRENVWYSGSTERIGLSDLATKPGYVRVSLNGDTAEPEHRPLPSREHLVLPLVHGDGLTADAIVAEVVRRLEREPARTRAQAMVLSGVRDTALGVDREVVRLLRNLDIVKECWAFVPDVRAVRAPGVQSEEASPIGQLLDEFNEFVTTRATDGIYEPAFASSFRETGRALLEEAMRTDEEAHPTAVPPEPAVVGGAP